MDVSAALSVSPLFLTINDLSRPPGLLDYDVSRCHWYQGMLQARYITETRNP